MGQVANLKRLVLLSREYISDADEYSKLWINASKKLREMERELLSLSDQLRCLSMCNETNLSAMEIQRASDSVITNMEERFCTLVSILEFLLKRQESLTTLRQSIECQFQLVEKCYLVQSIKRRVYKIWISFQFWSSSTDAALKTVDFKSPESISLLVQCVSGLGDHNVNELKDLLETADNLLSTSEF